MENDEELVADKQQVLMELGRPSGQQHPHHIGLEFPKASIRRK